MVFRTPEANRREQRHAAEAEAIGGATGRDYRRIVGHTPGAARTAARRGALGVIMSRSEIGCRVGAGLGAAVASRLSKPPQGAPTSPLSDEAEFGEQPCANDVARASAAERRMDCAD